MGNLAQEIRRAAELIADEHEYRDEAMRWLFYLAQRDHRHLLIDENPEAFDVMVSVRADPDKPTQAYVIDSSFLMARIATPQFTFDGGFPWSSPSC